MLHAARLRHVLDALRAAAQASAEESDPQMRSSIIEAGVEQLLAEIAEAENGDDLPGRASQVLGLFEQIGLPEDQSGLMGQVILGLGKTYERMGNNPQAYESYKNALGLAQATNDAILQAGCLRRMGRVLVRMARWAEALEHFNRSLQLFDDANDRAGRAAVLLDLGILHYQQGNLDQAESRYNEALEIAEEDDHVSIAINARNNLGIVANIRGDAERAIAHYQSCVPLAEQAGMDTHLARAYHNLGMAHADRRSWQEAGDCYERALRIARANSMAELVATVQLNRSEMYLELGDVDMAAVSCGSALSIYNAAHHRLGEAEAYRVLGRIFARRSDEITAGEMFNQSLAIAREAPAPLELGETYHAMGLAWERLGKTEEAAEALEEAVQHFEEVQAIRDLDMARADLERVRSG
jgi:tetratricopeptide (TPR) repeat protein